jgi:hypothetical protein
MQVTFADFVVAPHQVSSMLGPSGGMVLSAFGLRVSGFPLGRPGRLKGPTFAVGAANKRVSRRVVGDFHLFAVPKQLPVGKPHGQVPH